MKDSSSKPLLIFPFVFANWFGGVLVRGCGKEHTLNYIISLFNFITFVATAFEGTLVDDGLHKSHPVSLNIIGGMQSDIFIVVFVRNLFSNITTWDQFFVFTSVTVIIDSCSFMLAISHASQSLHDKILAIAEPCHQSSTKSIPQFFASRYARSRGYRSGAIVGSKIALQYALKYAVMLVVSFSYVIFSIWLRYGYNRDFYSPKEMSNEHFQTLMIFVLLSVIFETLTIIPANNILISNTGFSLWNRLGYFAFFYIFNKQISPSSVYLHLRRWVSFFHVAEGKQYYVFFCWATAHVISDVFVAKILYKDSSGELN